LLFAVVFRRFSIRIYDSTQEMNEEIQQLRSQTSLNLWMWMWTSEYGVKGLWGVVKQNVL